MSDPFPYIPIPGRRRGVLFSSSLWMAEDHILLVRNSRFSETYKRFFFRDIEALLIRRGPRFSFPAYWLMLFLALLFGLALAFASGSQTGIWTVSSGLTAVLIYLLIECFFLSCTTHIRTAVSSEELNALFRTRHALKAAELIAVKIEAVQGIAEPVDVQRPDSNLPLPSNPDIKAPPSRTALALTLASFLFLLVDSAFTYYSSRVPVTPRLSAVTSILILTEAALLISALVSLWPGNSTRALRNLIIVALVFSGVAYYAGSMGSQIAASLAQANIPPSATIFKTYRAAIDRLDEIGNLALGVAGIIAWTKTSRR